MQRRAIRVLQLAAGLALGAATTAAPAQQGRRSPDLEPRANPSAVVAAEIALMRESRELGRQAALRRAAAPGALIGGTDGPVPFTGLPAYPVTPERRAARIVWSSCDGTLAVSYGRTRMAGGAVGSFLTVWQLQKGNRGKTEYRWLFETTALDDPQPAPPANQSVAEDDILVSGLDIVEGKVADCPQQSRRQGDEALPAILPAEGAVHTSRDATLRWRWNRNGANAPQVTVELLREGTWQEAIAYPAQAGNG